MYHFQTNGKLPISSKSQDTFSPHQLVRDIFKTTRKVAFFHQMLTCHFLFTCFKRRIAQRHVFARIKQNQQISS